jgi:hypothetical protein
MFKKPRFEGVFGAYTRYGLGGDVPAASGAGRMFDFPTQARLKL